LKAMLKKNAHRGCCAEGTTSFLSTKKGQGATVFGGPKESSSKREGKKCSMKRGGGRLPGSMFASSTIPQKEEYLGG